MRLETVNMYEYARMAPGPNAVGKLRGFLPETPEGLRPRRRPAVLILPGGAYRYTSQREAEPVALRFLARGWAAFVLDYTCAPAAFPVALREAAAAMRYIRENAGRLEVDPQGVAAVGFSAGGHLCGTLGTMWDCPEAADIAPAELIRPDALGLCYPVAVSWGATHEESFQNLTGGDAALRSRLSLDNLVREDMPPVFLWHTRDDGSVPCRNSLLLAQKMDEMGVDFALRIYRHGRHGLSTADGQVYPVGEVPPVSPDVKGWVDEMLDFFAQSGLVPSDVPLDKSANGV